MRACEKCPRPALSGDSLCRYHRDEETTERADLADQIWKGLKVAGSAIAGVAGVVALFIRR